MNNFMASFKFHFVCVFACVCVCVCVCAFGKVAPQGWKWANRGCTQTTAVVPAEPETPWIQKPKVASVFEWELVYPTQKLHWLGVCFTKKINS
jgi:hypothetical protein